jgi:hypothetical protein
VLDDAVAQQDLVTHPLPAQVEVTVLQAQRLVHGPVAFDLEGRRLGGVEDLEPSSLDLYRSCRQVGVLVTLWTAYHFALYGDGPLGPESLGRGEYLGPFRVEHDLCDAPTVAQVDEDQTPVVPASVYPACEPDLFSGVVFAELACAVGPVRVTLVLKGQFPISLCVPTDAPAGWSTNVSR